MTEVERQELLQELEILEISLNFHVENRESVAISKKEFEDYVNAVLDRITEI